MRSETNHGRSSGCEREGYVCARRWGSSGTVVRVCLCLCVAGTECGRV